MIESDVILILACMLLGASAFSAIKYSFDSVSDYQEKRQEKINRLLKEAEELAQQDK